MELNQNIIVFSDIMFLCSLIIVISLIYLYAHQLQVKVTRKYKNVKSSLVSAASISLDTHS